MFGMTSAWEMFECRPKVGWMEEDTEEEANVSNSALGRISNHERKAAWNWSVRPKQAAHHAVLHAPPRVHGPACLGGIGRWHMQLQLQLVLMTGQVDQEEAAGSK